LLCNTQLSAERIKVLALNDAANNIIVDGLDESVNLKDGLLL
jgi:hypothetical protein